MLGSFEHGNEHSDTVRGGNELIRSGCDACVNECSVLDIFYFLFCNPVAGSYVLL